MRCAEILGGDGPFLIAGCCFVSGEGHSGRNQNDKSCAEHIYSSPQQVVSRNELIYVQTHGLVNETYVRCDAELS